MRGLLRVSMLLMTVSSLLLPLGCGGSTGPRRVQVYGDIQVDGQALEAGVIRFLPGEGNKGPAANVLISRGRFSFSATDGPQPGLYRVLIAISSPTTGKFSADSSAPVGRVEWQAMLKVPDETSFKQDFQLKANDPDVVTLEQGKS